MSRRDHKFMGQWNNRKQSVRVSLRTTPICQSISCCMQCENE